MMSDPSLSFDPAGSALVVADFGDPFNGDDDDQSSDSALSKEDMDLLIDDLGGEENNIAPPPEAVKGLELPSLSFSNLASIGNDDTNNDEGGDVPEPEDPASWAFPEPTDAEQVDDDDDDDDNDDEDEDANSEDQEKDDNDDEENGGVERPIELVDDDDDDPTVANLEPNASPKRPLVEDDNLVLPAKKRQQRDVPTANAPQIIRKPSLNEDSAVANFILSPWS